MLHLPDGKTFPMKVRSMVGLIPLFAVETLDSELIDQLPRFKHRLQWFIENRPISACTSKPNRRTAKCAGSSPGESATVGQGAPVFARRT